MTLRWIVDHDPEACRSTSTEVGQIRNVVDMRIDYYDGLAWPPAMYFAPPSIPRSAGSNEVCLTRNGCSWISSSARYRVRQAMKSKSGAKNA
jgi:hypothetical protein